MRLQFIILLVTLLCQPLGYCQSNKGFRVEANGAGTTFYVNSDFWEGCETGKGECPTLIFNRESLYSNVLLIMPCGGTFTTVSLYSADQTILKDDPIMAISVGAEECPPTFTLTILPDGEYIAYMMSCGLGGGIKFSLVTAS